MARQYREYPEAKGSGGGFWFYLIILALIAGGIYWWWGGVPGLTERKKTTFKFENLPKLLEKSPQSFKELKVLSEDLTQKIWKSATQTPKEFAGAIIEDVGKKAAESFKEETANVLGLAQNLGPNKVAIVRPVKQGLSLQLESGEEVIKYIFDWGDGQKEEGTLPAKEKKTFEHSWVEAGSYNAVVTVTNEKGEEKKSFTFPIVIYK